ncbi:hypothetical protein PM023_02120 [Halorubrum ezzemoulense]|uniref:hypothetical protein n=1 Tax=Halorubrum ezzemoulense TaxID=337243 RepID=UPI00232C857F|nr:hypothetical protein [Halorubrum ezzemoulense]MDB2223468.1 hypothetical protein [Halorubrum ezzemoulense]
MSAPDEPAASWPSKETNSVTASLTGLEEDADPIVERVTEFATEYPHLADLPLSEAHGRKLRRIVTEADWEKEFVDPDNPLEDSFAVDSLRSRSAGTWLDAIHAFLRAHHEYSGMMARFEDRESGDEFDVPLADAWGKEYSKKQYARARALQRQMSGGKRPSGGEAVPAWDDPVTVMLTLTASSVPDGDRLPPVEQMDAIHDAFSYGGVRDTLRNVMEYHLDLDSEQWGYWLQAEPHGMGTAADSDKDAGLNACYTHIHVGVYLDGARFGDLRPVASEFERVIDKHLEVCDPAGWSAHNYDAIDDYLQEDDGCISMNADVGNLGSYLAAYMGGYTEDLLDKPIEYIAWGAVYWSAARQRTTRSQTVNQAIRADRCEQRAENEESGQVDAHGERIRWDDGRGADVVCSCCGSPWTVDQDQLDGPLETESALDDDLRWAADAAAPAPEPEQDRSLAERWPSADSAWSYGESPQKTLIRDRVHDYLDVHGRDISLPSILAHLNIDPSYREFVGQILDGEMEPDSEAFDRHSMEPAFGYELKAIVDRDGNEHKPGSGGVDMVPLELPIRNLVENTRLRNDLAQGEIFRNSQTKFGSHDPKIIASSFLRTGIDKPEIADRLLTVEDYHVSNPQMSRDERRPCMVHPDKV